jgi:hypothetical protein
VKKKARPRSQTEHMDIEMNFPEQLNESGNRKSNGTAMKVKRPCNSSLYTFQCSAPKSPFFGAFFEPPMLPTFPGHFCDAEYNTYSQELLQVVCCLLLWRVYAGRYMYGPGGIGDGWLSGSGLLLTACLGSFCCFDFVDDELKRGDTDDWMRVLPWLLKRRPWTCPCDSHREWPSKQRSLDGGRELSYCASSQSRVVDFDFQAAFEDDRPHLEAC